MSQDDKGSAILVALQGFEQRTHAELRETTKELGHIAGRIGGAEKAIHLLQAEVSMLRVDQHAQQTGQAALKAQFDEHRVACDVRFGEVHDSNERRSRELKRLGEETNRFKLEDVERKAVRKWWGRAAKAVWETRAIWLGLILGGTLTIAALALAATR